MQYFNDSKYTKWYLCIIQNAICRKNIVYTEKHHIIPKCMSNEYIKEKGNLISLTSKEHFICHLLLTKMCIHERDTNKMIHALWRFMYGNKGQIYSPCARIHEYMRTKFINVFSQRMSGDNNHMRNPEWIARNMNRLIAICKDPIRNKKISMSKIKYYENANKKLFGLTNTKATMFEAYSLEDGDSWCCTFFCKDYGGKFINKDAGNILAQSKGKQSYCGIHPDTGARLGWRKLCYYKDRFIFLKDNHERPLDLY